MRFVFAKLHLPDQGSAISRIKVRPSPGWGVTHGSSPRCPSPMRSTLQCPCCRIEHRARRRTPESTAAHWSAPRDRYGSVPNAPPRMARRRTLRHPPAWHGGVPCGTPRMARRRTLRHPPKGTPPYPAAPPQGHAAVPCGTPESMAPYPPAPHGKHGGVQTE